jgi:hypothetical protein
MLLSLVAYWTLAHIAFFGDPRFHAPVVPMVAVLAGVAVAGIARPQGDAMVSDGSTPKM